MRTGNEELGPEAGGWGRAFIAGHRGGQGILAASSCSHELTGRACLGPTSVRLHGHLPLPLSPVDDGAGAAHRRSEDEGAPDGEERFNRVGPLLGAGSSPSISPSAWLPGFRSNFSSARTGRRFQSRRRRDRPDAGDGGGLRLLPRVDVSGALSASAKSGWARGGTGSRRCWCSWQLVAVRASSSSPRTPGCSIPAGYAIDRHRRRFADQSFAALPAEPVDPVAVPAQHERLGGDGGRS